MNDARENRRDEERRGSLVRSGEKLKLFIYHYWERYYRDHPDLDRRKEPDRRRNKHLRTNF